MGTTRINISIDEDELAEIDAAAGEGNRSRYMIDAALKRAGGVGGTWYDYFSWHEGSSQVVRIFNPHGAFEGVVIEAERDFVAIRRADELVMRISHASIGHVIEVPRQDG